MSVCECGHGPTVHVGYTGGCGLCDACVGFRPVTVNGDGKGTQ
jgi:hypothetical protein